MSVGHSLNHEDRKSRFENVTKWAEKRLGWGHNCLITCCAPKRAYRDVVNRRGSGLVLVYLAGSRDTIASCRASRHGLVMALHSAGFPGTSVATFEEPSADGTAIRIEIGAPPATIAPEIERPLGLGAQRG